MANKGTTLTTNQSLQVGDYITSSDGNFIALFQSNGTIGVYHLSSTPLQIDPASGTPSNGIIVWTSPGAGNDPNVHATMGSNGSVLVFATGGVQIESFGSPGPAGDYFLTVDDAATDPGNLIIYAGTPASPGSVVWQSGVIDKVTGCNTITSIAYDTANYTIGNPDPPSAVDSVTAGPNNTPDSVSAGINQAISSTQTSGWADSLGAQIGVSTSFVTGVPFVAEGKVTVSASVSNTYTWNGSNSTTMSCTVTGSVSLPPNSPAVEVVITAANVTLTLPYTLTGILQYKSGITHAGQVSGTYTGTNATDFTITYNQPSGSSQVPGPGNKVSVPANVLAKESAVAP